MKTREHNILEHHPFNDKNSNIHKTYIRINKTVPDKSDDKRTILSEDKNERNKEKREKGNGLLNYVFIS